MFTRCPTSTQGSELSRSTVDSSTLRPVSESGTSSQTSLPSVYSFIVPVTDFNPFFFKNF